MEKNQSLSDHISRRLPSSGLATDARDLAWEAFCGDAELETVLDETGRMDSTR